MCLKADNTLKILALTGSLLYSVSYSTDETIKQETLDSFTYIKLFPAEEFR